MRRLERRSRHLAQARRLGGVEGFLVFGTHSTQGYLPILSPQLEPSPAQSPGPASPWPFRYLLPLLSPETPEFTSKLSAALLPPGPRLLLAP